MSLIFFFNTKYSYFLKGKLTLRAKKYLLSMSIFCFFHICIHAIKSTEKNKNMKTVSKNLFFFFLIYFLIQYKILLVPWKYIEQVPYFLFLCNSIQILAIAILKCTKTKNIKITSRKYIFLK